MKYFYQILLFVFIIQFNYLNAKENQDSIDDFLSSKVVKKSIVETLQVLTEVYVFPEKAKIVQAEITRRMNQGAYNHIKTKEDFISTMTDELIEVSKDGHLGVMLVKENETQPTPVLVETEDDKKYNYAFQKLEVMSGNIGYMKFNKFYLDDEAKITVDHAFGFLSHTDAMIIDLRDCIGGSAELARYILSYFFSEETLLWRIHDRGNINIYDHLSF